MTRTGLSPLCVFDEPHSGRGGVPDEVLTTIIFRIIRMNRYISDADDFYVNVHLNTEMELPNNRDTVLHFFEQMKKGFPELRNFYTRENGDLVLEGEKEAGLASLAGHRAAPALLGPLQPRGARRLVSPARAGPRSGPALVDDQLARLRSARRHVWLRLQFRRQPRRGRERGPRGRAWPGGTLRVAAGPGDQLRAVDHPGPERIVSASVPAGDRDPDQRLQSPAPASSATTRSASTSRCASTGEWART